MQPGIYLGKKFHSNALLVRLGPAIENEEVSGLASLNDEDTAGDSFYSRWNKKLWLVGPFIGIDYTRALSPHVKLVLSYTLTYYRKVDASGFSITPGSNPDGTPTDETHDNKFSNITNLLTLGIRFDT